MSMICIQDFLILEDRCQYPEFNGVLASCRFRTEQLTQRQNQRWMQLLDPLLLAAAPTRRAEYIAGRYAASVALKELGQRDTLVGRGHHGQPLWPQAVVGSITHQDFRAIAVVARLSECMAIGVDLEHVLSPIVALSIADQVVSQQELRLFKRFSMSINKAITLAFSAKESLFKALYPCVNRYFDFRDVQVVAVNVERATISMQLLCDLSPLFCRGREISACFNLTDVDCFTVVALPPGS